MMNQGNAFQHPAILHHYTTLAGFEGITRQKKLYATGIRHLNDATEYTYANELVLRAINHVARQQPNETAAVISAVVEDVGFSSIGEMLFTVGAFYVASFSENDDQLSQWRAYCQGGGYCLGFRTSSLLTIAQEQEFDLIQCSYDVEDQRHVALDLATEVVKRVKKLPNEIIAAIAAIITRDEKLQIEHYAHLQPIRNWLQTEIARVAPTFKHPAFKEEAEWRLVSSNRHYHTQGVVEFRVGRTSLIPYINIELDRASTVSGGIVAVLEKIEIGPCAEPDLALASVMFLCDKRKFAGLSYGVSRAPFRHW